MKRSIIIVLLLVMIAMLLVGCVRFDTFFTGQRHETPVQSSPDDHPLVGIWIWDGEINLDAETREVILEEHPFGEFFMQFWDRAITMNTSSPEYLFVFHADGRGTRGTFPAVQSFTWSISEGGYLLIDNGNFIEEWDYTIYANVLTTYTRPRFHSRSFIRAD